MNFAKQFTFYIFGATTASAWWAFALWGAVEVGPTEMPTVGVAATFLGLASLGWLVTSLCLSWQGE